MPQMPASTFLWLVAVLGFFSIACLAGAVRPSVAILGIVVLCAGCELVDSSLGMGYGTVLTPVMILLGYEPLQLVPTILVSEFLSGLSAAFFHAEVGNIQIRRGSVHLRAAAILSLCSFLGVFAGVELAFNVSRRSLTRLISLVIVAAGLYVLASAGRVLAYRTWKMMLLALAASFNKAISGGGYGPLMTTGQVLSGVEGRAAVGITSLAEGFTCLAGASLFLLKGNSLDAQLLLPVVSGALLSVPFSARIVRRIPETAMKRIIALLTVALGAFMLVRTFVL